MNNTILYIGHFQLEIPEDATEEELEKAFSETVLRNEHYKETQQQWIPFDEWLKLVNIKDKLAAYGL